MVIDAHQHFWLYDPTRHSWITPEMAAIQRDFLPEDLEPLLQANGVEGCVAVQTEQTPEETTFLIRLAEAHPFVKGVVGWVDFMAPDLLEQLDYYTQYESLKGFRHIVQAEPEDFLLNEQFAKGVRQLYAFGFTYDLLIYPSQMQAALHFVKAVPNVPIVIDHLAKPYIREGNIRQWKADMIQLAAQPNVWCKLSGMVTEANWQHWEASEFIPYLDVVLEAFGTDRLLYGSDWPVCLVAAEYAQVFQVVHDYLQHLSATERAKILGENSLIFYKLDT